MRHKHLQKTSQNPIYECHFIPPHLQKALKTNIAYQKKTLVGLVMQGMKYDPITKDYDKPWNEDPY